MLILPKVYKEKGKLKKHIDYEHKNKERYTCVECHKKYMSKSSFTLHTNIHRGVMFSCDNCVYTTSSLKLLRDHKKNNHEKQVILDCDTCDYKGKRRNLREHVKSNQGSERFKCESCDYLLGH